MSITANFLKQYVRINRRNSWSRERMLQFQDTQLRELLEYVWEHSQFYHQLYSQAGLSQSDLPTVPLSDLPVVTKEQLMANFDNAITVPGLKKKEIEEWLRTHRTPDARYLNKYVVLHTSGSSGTVGLFVYDQSAWDTLRASLVSRVSGARLNPLRKVRFAYYAATHGRFAGITAANDVPKAFYELLPLSILSPIETVCDRLTSYNPDLISGYSSTVTHLAEKQIAGLVHVAPKQVVVSGDRLTAQMRKIITTAWPKAVLINMYAASESIGIAAQHPTASTMRVFDDLHIIELLAKEISNNATVPQPVATGETGHIVLTNLYNRTLPLIRYAMHDMATSAEASPDEPFSHISKIHGRSYDALPITLDTGRVDDIHPIILSEFFVPHLQKIQFAARSQQSIEIRYVSDQDITIDIQNAFNTLLVKKGAIQATQVEVKRKNSLMADRTTGKLPLVSIEY